MEIEKNKSIYWINALKAISILAVFFCHTQLYYGCSLDRINQFINPWYVNAFFFISGYLLFWKQLSEPRISEDAVEYRNKSGRVLFFNIIFRIIIPSIVFSVIEFVPSCLVHGRRIDLGFALYKTIGGGTYWFTSALAVSEIVLLILFCLRKRSIWFYTFLCFLLSISSLILVRIGTLNSGIWAWRQGLLALVFISLGGIYWRYEKKIDSLKKWWIIILLAAGFAFIVGFSKHANPLISTLTIQPLGFFTSTCSCLLLVWFCKSLREVQLLTFIGRNSLGFYFMSGALPITLSLVAHRLIPGVHIWLMFLIWVLCVGVALLIVKTINRWMPWLWDMRSIRK